ncbi:MAG: ferredoxin, partial [Clostridia bacterium]|nr:ferredoxin [Clostridia bacterium]
MNILLLNSINIGKLFIVLGIVAGISIIFTVLMVLVSKLCATPVDEKVEKVKEKLANANCGGCGYAGCADFAKALVEGKTDITKCNPTPNSNKEEIAKIIGVEFSASVEKYAVVHCAGGINSINKYQYVGNKDCDIINSVQGGKKICPKGCLGEGNCVKKCPFNSIKIIDGVASINKALCEACGICVN